MQAYARWVRAGIDLLPGDVVRHPVLGRTGVVIQTRAEQGGDGIASEGSEATTMECEVKIFAPNTYNHLERRWWSSSLLERATPDPHRRYLAMCAAEDSQNRSIGRMLRSTRAQGRRGYLPVPAWEKMHWQLANWEHLIFSDEGNPRQPQYHAGDLGRKAWQIAYFDCLRRRDRARLQEVPR